MAAIFVSYRRDDAAGHAGRLCDRLTARFGGDQVFRDIEDIHPGDDFSDVIGRTIGMCDVTVALVGPRWLTLLREREGQAEDWVRLELVAALERNVPLIPVLVGGAAMPRAEELPAELAGLSRRQAIEISEARFDHDVGRLESALERVIRRGGNRRRWIVLGAGAGAAAVAAAVFRVTGTGDAPAVAGTWIAEMRRDGQPGYRIRLQLEVAGDRLLGSVVYPTGDGVIEEGRIDGRRLSFRTRHVPQFANEPATIRLEGRVVEDGIELMLTSDSGIANGLAVRAGR